jgi:hypothetical protein
MAFNPTFSTQVDTEIAEKIRDVFEDVVDDFIDELAEEVEWEWRKQASASSKLRSTKKQYLDAIEVVREGDDIHMVLNDPIASAVEDGSSEFDLKPGFLRGKPYRTIPIVESSGTVTKFRRVSQSSTGWRHPGIEARSITDQVKNELDSGLVVDVFKKVVARTLA